MRQTIKIFLVVSSLGALAFALVQCSSSTPAPTPATSQSNATGGNPCYPAPASAGGSPAAATGTGLVTTYVPPRLGLTGIEPGHNEALLDSSSVTAGNTVSSAAVGSAAVNPCVNYSAQGNTVQGNSLPSANSPTINPNSVASNSPAANAPAANAPAANAPAANAPAAKTPVTTPPANSPTTTQACAQGQIATATGCQDTAQSCFAKSQAIDPAGSGQCVACSSPKNNANGVCQDTAASCAAQGLGLNNTSKTCMDCTASLQTLQAGLCVPTAAYCLAMGQQGFNATTNSCVQNANSCAFIGAQLNPTTGNCMFTPSSCSSAGLQYIGSSCQYTQNFCVGNSMTLNASGTGCMNTLNYCRTKFHTEYVDGSGNCTNTLPQPLTAQVCQANGMYLTKTSGTPSCTQASVSVCAENLMAFNSSTDVCYPCNAVSGDAPAGTTGADWVYDATIQSCREQKYDMTVTINSVTPADLDCLTPKNGNPLYTVPPSVSGTGTFATNTMNVTIVATASYGTTSASIFGSAGTSHAFGTLAPWAPTDGSNIATLKGVSLSAQDTAGSCAASTSSLKLAVSASWLNPGDLLKPVNGTVCVSTSQIQSALAPSYKGTTSTQFTTITTAGWTHTTLSVPQTQINPQSTNTGNVNVDWIIPAANGAPPTCELNVVASYSIAPSTTP